MKIFLLLALNILASVSICEAGKYNISFAVLDHCKQYLANIGYNYRHHFKIADLKHATPKDDELLRLNIVILGQKDAHILLTPSTDTTPDMAVYEIVLGAGANSFCEIRRKKKSQPLKTKRMEILSPTDPVPIAIRLTRSGLIEVGVKGEGLQPLISAEDPNPILDIKYISFGSWGSSGVRFFYDCPQDDDGQQIDEVPRVLTDKERLLEDLLTGYDSFLPPEDLEDVLIDTMTLKSVSYDSKTTILSSRIQVVLNWTDPKLVWDPSDYVNIRAIRNPVQSNFWKPSLLLLNGAGETHKELDIQYSYTLTHNGAVSSVSNEFEVTTFCPVNTTDFSWPSTTVRCAIELMISHFSLAGYDSSMKIAVNEGASSWKIIDAFEMDDYLTSALNFMLEDDAVDDDNNAYPKSPKMFVSYQLLLTQNQEYFRFLFRAPLQASVLLLAIATLSSNYPRYCLIMIAFLIGCISMMALADTAPTYYISKIGYFHIEVLVLCWLSIVVSIVNTWCMKFNEEAARDPPTWIASTTNWSWMKFSLGFGSSYDYLEDQQRTAWSDITALIDRVWLLLLCIYAAIIFASI